MQLISGFRELLLIEIGKNYIQPAIMDKILVENIDLSSFFKRREVEVFEIKKNQFMNLEI
jgi:hypothetical protein